MSENHIEKLPNELLSEILSYIPPTSNLNLVSKRFNNITTILTSRTVNYLNNKYPNWTNDPTPIFKNEDLNVVILAFKMSGYNNLNRLARVTDNKDVLVWAIGKGVTLWKWVMGTAIRNKFADIFELSMQHFTYWPKISYYAGRYYDMELIKDLERRRRLDANSLSKGAARSGHLEIIESVVETITNSLNIEALCYYASKGGYLNIIYWLRDNLHIEIPWVIVGKGAAKGNKVGLLKLAIKNGFSDWEIIAYDAAWGNSRRILSMAIAHGNIPPPSAAARGGHKALLLELLQLNKNEGITWNWNEIAVEASEGGYINIVKMAMEEYHLDWQIMAQAAAHHGYDDIVELAIENYSNLRWQSIVNVASKHGYINILELAKKEGALNKYMLGIVAEIAVRSDNITLLQFVANNSSYGFIDWNRLLLEATKYGYKDIINIINEYLEI